MRRLAEKSFTHNNKSISHNNWFYVLRNEINYQITLTSVFFENLNVPRRNATEWIDLTLRSGPAKSICSSTPSFLSPNSSKRQTFAFVKHLPIKFLSKNQFRDHVSNARRRWVCLSAATELFCSRELCAVEGLFCCFENEWLHYHQHHIFPHQVGCSQTWCLNRSKTKFQLICATPDLPVSPSRL